MKTLSALRIPIKSATFASMFLVAAVLAGGSAAGAAAKPDDSPALLGKASATARDAPGKRGRLLSFVVLLENPREIDEAALGTTIRGALGIVRSPGTVDENFLVAKPPYYKVEIPSGVYVINNIAEPYFDNADKLAGEIEEPALREAVAKNHAWISVDWAGREEPADLRAAYSDMGKMAAVLAKPDALAIYSPEAGQLSIFDGAVATAMTGDDPVQIFDGRSDDTVSISDDDPALQAAQAKARKTFPDFTRAFEAKAGKDFAVSGRIVEGENSESMWLSVTSIDGDLVHGTLDNSPVVVTSLKMGQDLHIQVSEVDDWIYVGTDDVPVGGFTSNALDHARETASNDVR